MEDVDINTHADLKQDLTLNILVSTSDYRKSVTIATSPAKFFCYTVIAYYTLLQKQTHMLTYHNRKYSTMQGYWIMDNQKN